jgi:hypothetical protein
VPPELLAKEQVVVQQFDAAEARMKDARQMKGLLDVEEEVPAKPPA